MSKMSELSQTLDDLIRCGEDLIRVAGEIKEIFSGDAEAEKEKAPEAEPVKAAAEAEGKKKMSERFWLRNPEPVTLRR